MNICIVSHNYPTTKQPYLQTFIRDQVRVLTETEGYRTRVLVPTPLLVPFSKRWSMSRVPLLDSEKAKRFRYFSIPKRMAPKITGENLAENLQKNLADSSEIIHVHWLYPNGIAIPILKKSGYQCILNLHGTDWHSTKNDPRFTSLIKDVLTSADVIVVSGIEIKNEILNRFPDLDVRVSFNYIDTDLFRLPDQAMKLKAQKRLNFDAGKLNIFTVANFRPEKGVDVFLDAIAKIHHPNICFHILGQQASGPYAKVISKKLRFLPKNIVKVHSPVPRHEIPSYYFAADAYLLPSRSEGFNVSLLEALSTGLPVIATKTGGAINVLDNDRGMIVDPDDPEALSDAIMDLARTHSLTRSQKSRDYVTNNFSLQHYSEFLVNLYSSFDSDY